MNVNDKLYRIITIDKTGSYYVSASSFANAINKFCANSQAAKPEAYIGSVELVAGSANENIFLN